MSVTTTQYGANREGATFKCLHSGPDVNSLSSITSGRLVMRGTTSPYNTLALPGATLYTSNTTLKTFTAHLPTATSAHGVFYCEASDNVGVLIRVPVTLLQYNSKLIINHQ